MTPEQQAEMNERDSVRGARDFIVGEPFNADESTAWKYGWLEEYDAFVARIGLDDE